ncbi:transposase [Gemmobacter serpentinus]|uniref:transposase n=1 Tax=Gemmobacter serpentinus TaxID=2652247 RepID=UPI00186573CB
MAIQLCLSAKVLFKPPLRQAVGMVPTFMKLAGLDWPMPDHTTLCSRQKSLAVQVRINRRAELTLYRRPILGLTQSWCIFWFTPGRVAVP